MKISALATLLFAANAATTHATETKQHVRKAQDDVAEKENWGIGDFWDKYKPAPPHTCGGSHFSTGTTFSQDGTICTIVPALANQPGAPSTTDGNGVFCTGGIEEDEIGPYSLTIETVPLPYGVMGAQDNLIRIVLDLDTFPQNPAPGEDTRRLQANPMLDPAVNGGDGKPTTITFQGTWSPDCSFRAVSTQGGMITGNMDYWTHSGHDSVSVDFTQSGQVTSSLTSLPGQFQTDGVVGIFVSNFAFAFSASFSDHVK